MDWFNKLISRSKPVPDLPEGKATHDHKAWMDGSPAPIVDGSPLIPLNGSYTIYPADIVAACVRVITNRALQSRFIGTTADMRSKLRGIRPGYTRRQFFQSIYEGLLVQGNVLLWREQGVIRFATDANLGFKDGMYSYNEYDPIKGSTTNGSIKASEAVLLRHEMLQGQTNKGRSPAYMAAPGVQAYRGVMNLLQSYAERVGKAGLVIRPQEKFDGMTDDVAEFVTDLVNKLKEPGSYRTIVLREGFQADFPNYTNPVIMEAVEAAVTSVARQFGVPVALLNVTQRGVRQPLEELDAHLVRGAVLPLMETVQDGLISILDKDNKTDEDRIVIDRHALHVVTWAQAVSTSKDLAHMGIATGNELRRLLDWEDIPEGEGFPEVVGGVERGNQGTTKDTDDDSKT